MVCFAATPVSPQRVVGLVSLVVMTAIELIFVLIGGLVFIGIGIRTLRRMSQRYVSVSVSVWIWIALMCCVCGSSVCGRGADAKSGVICGVEPRLTTRSGGARRLRDGSDDEVDMTRQRGAVEEGA